MRTFFELFPLVLAVVSAAFCSMRYQRDRRKHDRLAMICGTLASVMLVVAQTSWVATHLAGDLVGENFANVIWTLFNNLVMLTFIFIAWPRVSK